ncbi:MULTISPECIES: DUF6694 family lipoprotein [unclassified Gilliamella]|uniref:DUF6694 family lipoprotein n=1 Tax=unclassified Gilliamella TaxID=2685620 RepID=UPI000A34057E|nr:MULTISPECIES: DUF6694 family lipoprotein [unclassified Gilliamella]OTQ71488.1 hypothetical protein B6C99_12245 [Gilliamella sp. N-G2]OTQ77412.1 hypothetical protein B6D23_11830 [Gilliamella sp. N-W3]
MFKKLLAVSLLSFVLVGCGDDAPKLDLSSKEAYTTSAQKAGEKLSDTDKVAFARAMVKVAATAATNQANSGDENKIFAEIKSKLDGKTAKEVISEFDK